VISGPRVVVIAAFCVLLLPETGRGTETLSSEA
jgi:hypothetical protein